MVEYTNTNKNIFWSGIERFSNRGIQFVLSLIIARLLLPSEYGLIAMTVIFTSIAQVFIDSGFGNALIQKKIKIQKIIRLFFFNIIISIAVYIILFLSSPLISDFYNQPILTPITRTIGLCLVISSLSIVPKTILTINSDFRHQAHITIIASIISGILGIVCAYKKFGVWALVIQNLGSSVLLSFLYFIYAKWIPKLFFCWQSFKSLFLFGSRLLGSSLLHTIYINLYSLVIGKFYSPSDVGLYNRGTSLAQYFPIFVSSVITNATYPIQCLNQADNNWIKSSLLKYIKNTCMLVFPIMGLLVVLSKPVVLLILTEKWIAVTKILPILAMSYAIYPIGILNNYTLLARGHSGSFFKAEIIKKFVGIIILLITLRMGLTKLCIGIFIYNIFDVILIMSFSKKLIGVKIISQIKNILPILLITILSSLCAYIPRIFIYNILPQILCSGIVFLFIFLILGICFNLIHYSALVKIIKRLKQSLT